jgi:hypothetical protein
MTTYVVIWVVLALIVLALAGWRQLIGMHEDDSIHLKDSQASLVTEQAMLGRKIGKIDRVGQTLTVVTVLYGLALAGWVLYEQWLASSKLPV